MLEVRRAGDADLETLGDLKNIKIALVDASIAYTRAS